jgi:NTP pyrophosphatase (non-canonical NTP hydrolase)
VTEQPDLSEPNGSEPTRERVRATIGEVGGYWRPLAAVARLQEELGELAELLALERRSDGAQPLRQGSPDAEPCASELADLWIITTALADQFLARVAEPDSYAHRTTAPHEAGLGELVVAAGRIARIVNYYDGPKTPRTFDGWISLSDAVAELHRALADVAHAHEVDLDVAVHAKLDAIPVRDSGRFREGKHDDPSTAASLERFRLIGEADAGLQVECVRLWGAPEWSSRSFSSNVGAIVEGLVSFAKAARWERLDGYLVSAPQLVSTELLEEWLERLLREISVLNPTQEQPPCAPLELGPARMDDRHRHLFFNGLCLRVAVFSELYGAGDPRRHPSGTFVLLEREDSVGG